MAEYAGYYVFEQSHLAEHEDDQYAGQRGYVKGTDFSLPYYSSWSRRHDSRVQLNLLRCLNCSYLSTHGVAPTMLALKQHAQSLCILIHALNPTVQIGEIGDGDPNKIIPKAAADAGDTGPRDPLTFKYNMNDAFDFLTDLTRPYSNDDPSHHKPLTGLLNEICARDEAHGNIHHCPLSETKPRAKQEAQKPYANHHNLIMHANECLERLDHEFSSTGGLLSILPTDTSYDEGNQQLAAARQSLLGQWLLYTQHLVARMHDLERSYANALDALAGEAMIPLQARSGIQSQGGRPIIYPQDRFVLVNAGDDIFDHIHRVLDKHEASMRAKEEIWANNGVLGKHIYKTERGGSTFERGLVAVDISTRYYRLTGQGRNTVFVVPAWNSHPGVEQTKLTEGQPTIVASIQPTLPKRVTELEKQFTDGQEEIQRISTLMESYKEQSDSKDKQLQSLSAYTDQLTFTRDALMKATGKDKQDLAEDAEIARRQMANALAESQQSQRQTQEMATRVAHLEQRIRELNRLRARLEAQNRWRRSKLSTSSALAFLLTTTTALSSPLPPYTPTTIFLPPQSDTAFIFSPSSSGPNSTVSLLSLNISSLTSSSSSSAPRTLSETLPISSGDAFVPLLLPNNTLAIFSGSCSTPSSSKLHTFDFVSQKWIKSRPGGIAVSPESDYAQTVPFRLSSGVAFSRQLEPVLSAPAMYFYGGQCGDETYSNTMLRLGSDDGMLSTVNSGGNDAPVPAAGFSLTELTPASTSNRSGVVTQSSSYLLLGGHTAGGTYVNVSTVGVWNLPGEGWEFLSVRNGEGRVEGGRSGHTSVVSEDGGRVVVYGGLVGSEEGNEGVGMGVLKVGVGGEGWEWEDLGNKGKGETGRYGHGAVRLPGDVMMVYGGWEVGSGSKKGKREEIKKGGLGLRFLDMGKLEWVDKYELPKGEGNNGGGSSGGGKEGGSGSGSGNGSGTGSGSGNGSGNGNGNSGQGSSKDEAGEGDDGDRNKIIGLSVGLGVGLFVLALAALGFCLIRRRKIRRRAAREETLRGLALGMNGSLPRGLGGDGDVMMERDDGMGLMFPWNAATARQWYTGGDDPYSQGQRSLGQGYESLRGGVRKTGATVYMPPPPSPSSASSSSMIGGRPRNARGLYTPTNVNTYDFAPLGQASRNIDPIYEEADEEEEEDLANKENYHHPISPDKEDFGVGGGGDDPFLTPTTSIGGNNTTPVGLLPPPTISQQNSAPAFLTQQDPEVQNWKSEIDAADAVLSARIARHGSTTTAPPRLTIPPVRTKSVKLAVMESSTPPESDRSNSNLSEKSAFSFVAGGDSQYQQQQQQQQARLGTAGSAGEESSSSAKTFSTAKSSFPVLQAEGPGLLSSLYDGGPREKEEEDADYVYVAPPGSPSKSPSRRQSGIANGNPGNRRSWFGSLRRVFSGGTNTPESSSGGSNTSLNRGGMEEDGSGGGIGGDYQGLGLGGLGTGGGLLLQRRKQGKEAWEGGQRGNGGEGDDDDWDVERAVEQRLVQIMFTVPKERLRVVNAEVECASVFEGQSAILEDVGDEEGRLRVPSDGAISKQKRPVSMAGSSTKSVYLDPGGGISPSASLRTMSIRTGTLHTAEAVRLERPKTRVLAMVESIESKSSRDSSPAPSGKSGKSGIRDKEV
ncbi:hypothetical protein QBC44DRAFT_253711 [Cladorrhinum sp. PSN332]|nr:hypothetical protein QBC44DRAFT_253711 [Cladorrhinum sp. PSN332]